MFIITAIGLSILLSGINSQHDNQLSVTVMKQGRSGRAYFRLQANVLHRYSDPWCLGMTSHIVVFHMSIRCSVINECVNVALRCSYQETLYTPWQVVKKLVWARQTLTDCLTHAPYNRTHDTQAAKLHCAYCNLYRHSNGDINTLQSKIILSVFI